MNTAPCIFCGTPTPGGRTTWTIEVAVEKPTGHEGHRLPALHICGKCSNTHSPARYHVGFCPYCWAWGRLDETSDCGRTFMLT